MQYELTSKAVNLMFGYFTFFFSWAVVLCQWNFIRETWVKALVLVLPVPDYRGYWHTGGRIQTGGRFCCP